MFLTDQNEMSNINREPSIDDSYQVLVHLGKMVSEENKPETRIAYGDQIRTKSAILIEDLP